MTAGPSSWQNDDGPVFRQPFSSFHPGQLWPDDHGTHINAHGGGILFHQYTYYWFGEHKIAGSAGNAAHVGVHCYSSVDLYNWKDEGIALSVSADPGSDIAKGHIIERPKVLFNARTGKFVMWFHLELTPGQYHSARVGTAIADSPAGPYRYLRSFRPNAGHWPINVPDALRQPLSSAETAALSQIKFTGGYLANYPADLLFRRDHAGGQMSRDMTLFLDDDGQAYHLCASEENGTLHISRLTDDFLDSSGQYVRLFSGRFHEAPAICKNAGRYYLISSDCTGWAPNAARSAVADSVFGPWTELGNPCRGANAELTFGGQATYILPVHNVPGGFIFLADRWRPDNAVDGRYLWLPLQFRNGVPVLEWFDPWDLSFFRRPGPVE